MSFEIATWYDNWDSNGLNNLVQGLVPLNYAIRYNLAFGEFVQGTSGYTATMNQAYASQVIAALQKQAPGALIYAGIGDSNLPQAVIDNQQYANRSTANTVAYLLAQGLQGLTIDSEQQGMPYVVNLVSQLGPSFQAAGLGIAISVPWPGTGPSALYGDNVVSVFNQYVTALELQDYSSGGTPSDAPVWIQAGISPALLLGGVNTENGDYQTSLSDTEAWTTWALQKQLRGMFSWRLDNDHCTSTDEDVDPTFTGAKTIYETVQSYGSASVDAKVPGHR
jgi:hypothetical protein